MRRHLRPTLIIMALLLTWQVVEQLRFSMVVTKDSWGLTDWLINYSGGFVRRGLAGWMLHGLSAITGIRAHHLAIGFSLLFYAGLVSWFLAKASRHFSSTLLLSCLLLGFPVYQYVMIRKDALLLLLFIGCLKCLQTTWTDWPKWAAVNLLSCVALLLHETYAFFAIPALICFHGNSDSKTITKRCMALLPALLCFGLVSWRHGTPEIARAIHDSWSALWTEIPLDPDTAGNPFASIEAIGWTTGQGLEMTRGVLNAGIYQPAAWVLVIAISGVAALRFMKPDVTGEKRAHMAAVLGIQLIAISPLFVLGVDYGRWLFFWTASSIALHSCGMRMVPTRAIDLGSFIRRTRLEQLIVRIPRWEWALLAFGIPVLWSVRNFLTASPLGNLAVKILGFATEHGS